MMTIIAILLPEIEEKDGGLLGDVLNPGAEVGIIVDDEEAVADDPSCWLISRRRL